MRTGVAIQTSNYGWDKFPINKNNLNFILAPIGVATGITLWITLLIFICNKFGISKLTEIIKNVSPLIFFFFGTMAVIIWLPVFILGIYFLGRRGTVGQSDTLRENGIYKYVRNPMYSGISFTIIGAGLILNKTGVVLAGIIWFLMAFIQCKREEKELEVRFKEKYVDYKSKTPMFIPNIKLAMKDLFLKKKNKNYGN
jgi:protein-S-isoprenylcysteine O-methyltransferase Ste14